MWCKCALTHSLFSVAKHINETQRLADSVGHELLTNIPGFYFSANLGTMPYSMSMIVCVICTISNRRFSTHSLSDDLLVNFDVKYFKDVRDQDQPKPAYEPSVRNVMLYDLIIPSNSSSLESYDVQKHLIMMMFTIS